MLIFFQLTGKIFTEAGSGSAIWKQDNYVTGGEGVVVIKGSPQIITWWQCHLEVASTQEKFDGQGHPHLKRLKGSLARPKQTKQKPYPLSSATACLSVQHHTCF